ncbi:MAG: PEP-CTERM sorting domain-containing protein [Pirellulaceae bacterium]|nr:PEP-CTERM sorting domain-containing protein [Planctomycetales bacterium]
MKMYFQRLCPLLVVLSGFATPSFGITIFYGLGDEFAPSDGDVVQMSWFQDRGYTVDLWDNTRLNGDPVEVMNAANAADLVYVGESISSGRMRQLEGTTSPMILSEQFGADILGFFPESDSVLYDDDHGSPSAVNGSGIKLSAGSSFGTAVEIVNADHPIAKAAGVSAGPVDVYQSVGGRLSWSTVEHLPAGSADVIALLPAYKDDYPNASALFVIEAGKPLEPNNVDFDGFPMPNAPGMRIFTFLSDTNRGPEIDPNQAGGLTGESDNTGPGKEATLLTGPGKDLIIASIDYALGLLNTGGVPGDYNQNGTVDAADYTIWKDSFGSTTVLDADGNGNGEIDAADYTVWKDNFGNSAAVGAASAVPEPASVMLILTGGLMLLARRRR